MKTKDRIKAYVKSKGISVRSFEKTIEVANGYVNNIREDISPEVRDKILKEYPDFNRDFLVFGEGDPVDKNVKEVHILKNEAEDVGDVVEEYSNKNNDFEVLDNGLIRMRVKLVSQKARAGYLTGLGDPEYIKELPTHEVYVKEYHRGVYRSFEAVGDSMNDAPEGGDPSIKSIPEGSIATGRLISQHLWASRLHLAEYQRFIIVTWEDGIIMKEIIHHDVEKGIITCRSRNPDKGRFPDFDLSLKKVSQIFNIVQVTFIDK